VKVTQKYKVVQVLSGESTAKEIQLRYERIPSIGERRIMKGGQFVWIALPDKVDNTDPPKHWRCLKALPGPPEKLDSALAAEKRVAQLLAQLGREKAPEREAASAALAAMGEGILPFLSKHADAGPAEMRVHVGKVIQDIKTHWGPAVNGIQVGLEPQEKQYVFGQPLPVKLTIRNVGTTDQSIVWYNDSYSPISLFWQKNYLSEGFSLEASRMVLDQPNMRHWHRGLMKLPDPPAPPDPLVLKSGESKSEVIDLRQLDWKGQKPGKLGPGPWIVTVCYDPKADLNDLKSHLSLPGTKLERVAVDRVNSALAEIKIVSMELPGAKWTLEKALAEKGRLIVLAEALEDGIVENDEIHSVKVTQKCKVLQVLAGASSAEEATLHYPRRVLLLNDGERRIVKGEQVIWIVQPSIDYFPLNHWRGIKALADTPENRKALGVAPAD
jgi:hypothetical protein